MSGVVVGVNDALAAGPRVVNEDPYGQGWLVKVDLSDPGELSALMSAAEYEATLPPDLLS